tara:strand:- start:6943 stop:7527 length:585 start_codon:yes stop_codon:yes gene_type:complete
MEKNKIYTYSTLLLAVLLAGYLINSIKTSIDEEKRISTMEAKIIEKLKLIRNAQIAFESVKGQYTSDWDQLINFIDSGNIYLIQRREETILLEYGAEETTLYLDTIGSISVIDSLFSNIPNFSSKSLPAVPGIENATFKMWSGKIEKGGVLVNVVEVRNPKPVDPNRKESNEANIHKPLRFGSRISITTAGNWE